MMTSLDSGKTAGFRAYAISLITKKSNSDIDIDKRNNRLIG